MTESGDLAAKMVDGIHAYLDRATSDSIRQREQFWNRDFTSAAAYEKSVAANRERFRTIIGAVDERMHPRAVEWVATSAQPALIAEGTGYKVYTVRWPVFPGVFGEGLLLEPAAAPVARIVALPDADLSPEMLVGLADGLTPGAQFARRLAEQGCQVLIPVLIDRKSVWSDLPGVRRSNLPHREFVYRMSFEVGRHIIGYEVQKALAAVDYFETENAARRAPIGVAGYGEGGLLALYAAALDTRIDAALVSGYFESRQMVAREAIYRDIWGLLREFGDAEVASLIAPRGLVIEASRGPEIAGPPPAAGVVRDYAASGRLAAPTIEAVRSEFARATPFFAKLGTGGKLRLVMPPAPGTPGSGSALNAFLAALGVTSNLSDLSGVPRDVRANYDPTPRLKRQLDQLVVHTQRLVEESPRRRAEFWAKADDSSPELWRTSTRYHQDYIWDELIGRMPEPDQALNPRTRRIYDNPKFTGYEVTLDVWRDVFAHGILLVPKHLKPGERRPVVVCQHGLEGRPSDLTDPKVDHPAYHQYAVKLVEEGFIVYAPQNPYIGEDRFRTIQRKGHPLKLALFSFILGQHQRTLEWLASLPYVDASRIGFYGLSYGGKTAVRVPPLLDGYALSICSADFNEWVWKTTSTTAPYSYLFTREYDMYEFNFANVVNYAELANLMAPRPFMVERGHNDGVAPDEWVAYEFAKVRRFYDSKMKMPRSARIEFFEGPHTINGQGTFEFLREHLRWPE
jgi:dienelactone hydrolase